MYAAYDQIASTRLCNTYVRSGENLAY
jgi:hypothetical protein